MQNPGQGRARDHSGSSKFHSEKIHPLRQGIPLDPPGIAVGRARRPGRGPGRGALRRGDPRGTAPPRGVRCARARGGADGGDGAPGMRGLVGRAPRAPGAEEPPASSHLPSPAERAPNRGFGVNHTELLVRASSRRRGRGRRQQAPRSRPGRPVPPGPTVAGVTAAIGYHGRVIPGPGRQALPAWASLVLRRTLFHDRSRADPRCPRRRRRCHGPRAVHRPCIVRLRAVLADPERVDESALRDAGASTVMRIGRVVHVVVGPEGGRIAGRIRASLGGRV